MSFEKETARILLETSLVELRATGRVYPVAAIIAGKHVAALVALDPALLADEEGKQELVDMIRAKAKEFGATAVLLATEMSCGIQDEQQYRRCQLFEAVLGPLDIDARFALGLCTLGESVTVLISTPTSSEMIARNYTRRADGSIELGESYEPEVASSMFRFFDNKSKEPPPFVDNAYR